MEVRAALYRQDQPVYLANDVIKLRSQAAIAIDSQ